MDIDLNKLTLGEARAIAKMVSCISSAPEAYPVVNVPNTHAPAPVVICTDKRAVVFGYTSDASARPITLNKARMCLYWSADVGGVFGLSERGPTKGCKISAVAESLILEGVTAVFAVEAAAEKAWDAAPIQGR